MYTVLLHANLNNNILYVEKSIRHMTTLSA